MKKLALFTALLMLLPLFALAQHVNGVPLDSIATTYMRITPYSMPASSITLLVDYGQPISFDRTAVLKDENDIPIRFNGTVDGLNYMHSYGYALDHVFVTGETGGNVFYILKKVEPE